MCLDRRWSRPHDTRQSSVPGSFISIQVLFFPFGDDQKLRDRCYIIALACSGCDRSLASSSPCHNSPHKIGACFILTTTASILSGMSQISRSTMGFHMAPESISLEGTLGIRPTKVAGQQTHNFQSLPCDSLAFLEDKLSQWYVRRRRPAA